MSLAPLTVVFDVDGTLVDSERDGHRVAFNLAFAEFGLSYRWDPATYGRLLAVAGGQRRLDSYLAGRGLASFERERLVPRLHARKTELFLGLVADGAVPARPGALRLLDELKRAGVTVGVATTGSRVWVERLLERHFGLSRFAAVVTGDEVPHPKPHPLAYLAALRCLQARREMVVAVEDSDNGVRAARSAGLRVAVVANAYTAGQPVRGAAVVLDGFGMPDAPARVQRDDAGVVESGMLDLAALRRIAALPV